VPDLITIYTDGACSPNPGIGGWAAIILYNKNGEQQQLTLTGKEENTTNNRMEMIAVLNALKKIIRPCEITIFTDSCYVINGLGNWANGKPTKSGWIINWQKKGWQKRDGPVLNRDVWEALYNEAIKHLKLEFKFLKGHNGYYYNELCDNLAVEARNK
jgi:ribonuclease HI